MLNKHRILGIMRLLGYNQLQLKDIKVVYSRKYQACWHIDKQQSTYYVSTYDALDTCNNRYIADRVENQ